MEPFQLLCPGCASRLTVRNRSALGQRLACPKCREMILVAAPEGHDVGMSKVESSGFDDIDLDAILENQPAKPKPAARPARIETPRPQRATPNRAAAPAAMQPGEDWTNPATKKKQKAILLTMASLAGLLILTLTGFLIFASGGPEKRVAEGDDLENKRDSDEEQSTPPIDTPPTSPDDSDPGPVDEPKNLEPDPSTLPEGSTNVDEALPSVVPDSPPAIPGFGVPSDPPPIVEDSSADDEEDPPRKREPAARSEAAILRSVLAESGTSMIKLQNAASRVRENFSIGTPKYFFEKVDEATDFTRRKDQKLLGVSYKQQNLQTVMHELSSISGLRLTINAPEISANDQNSDPEITLTVENESTGSVIRRIAKSVGLVATETDDGFVLSRSTGDAPVSQAINVAAIIENQQDGESLAQLVQQMVWPGTWQGSGPANPQAQGQCQFANGSLELKHLPSAIEETQRLIKGLKAVSQNDLQGSELLQSITWIDRGEFKTPFASQNSVRTSVGEHFRTLKKDYQIQIMADWHALSKQGWTSDSLAAGWIEEATVGDVVRETARALNAGVYVVDERTVWLTSPEAANDIFLLKLYPLNSIANGKLDESSLRQILLESLGGEAFGPGTSLSFRLMNQQKLLVFRAPQTLHRQVEALLQELQ